MRGGRRGNEREEMKKVGERGIRDVEDEDT